MKKVFTLAMLFIAASTFAQDGKNFFYEVGATVTSSSIPGLKVNFVEDESWLVVPSGISDALDVHINGVYFTAFMIEGSTYEGIYYEQKTSGLCEVRVSFALIPSKDGSGSYMLVGEKNRIDKTGKKSKSDLQGDGSEIQEEDGN